MKPLLAPLPPGLVEPGSSVRPAAVIAFTEGPAVAPDGSVYFSDIQNDRILRLDPSGDLSLFREEAGRANGNFFDAEGRLVTCEGAEFGPGGRRRITRTDLRSGEVTVLADRFEGKRFNSPNDLVIDSRGRIYFTDPLYWRSDGRELDVEAVYLLLPSGEVRRILSQPEVEKPNGLALTPDEKTLYVVDSNPEPGGNRKVWAFGISESGAATGRRLIYDFGAGRGGDGMRLDVEGNLWIAAGINVARGRAGETLDVPAGIYVVSPAGDLLGRIPIPEDTVTNLTFGPPGRRTLYVTAGRNLYRLPISVAGHVPW
ncbi:MAG TPA: SMP-30/gluconolactonase/LRE family protein [Planctomycetota bacterium]|nr:SMP-30/gluconolactonase/LRE family protein [Planctomycetota bacterium]